MIKVNMNPPSAPEAPKPDVKANVVKVELERKGRRIPLVRFFFISFFLGNVFMFALAGPRLASTYRTWILLGAVIFFALQLFVAYRVDRTPRTPRPVGTLPKEEANAFEVCLANAGFKEPPGASAGGMVYAKDYWGTVYLYGRGYWEHLVAFADKTLEFSGYGVESLKAHLESLEKTGRPIFPKDAQERSTAEKVAQERSAARGDDGPIAIANQANSILAMAVKRGACSAPH